MLARGGGAVSSRETYRIIETVGLEFEERTVLDANLGAHMGFGGRISATDAVDFVAKNWQANSGNACGGLNHIVHVAGWRP